MLSSLMIEVLVYLAVSVLKVAISFGAIYSAFKFFK